MTRTNEKISKSYLSKVKNDADRKNPKHGLACEYLFEVLRAKQFLKEIKWLYINLRKDYKKTIKPLINKKIQLIKEYYKSIEIHKGLIITYQTDLSNNQYKIQNSDEQIAKYKQFIALYKKDLKLILQCRSEIFELINSISLGLITKNSLLLINFQKNIYNKIIIPSLCIEKPINSISISGNRTKSVIAFADVFIPYSGLDLIKIDITDPHCHSRSKEYGFEIKLLTNVNKYATNTVNNFYGKESYGLFSWDPWTNSTLGEVKISKQESEEVLQQINLYHELVFPTETFICLDYQDSQLLTLTKDSKIQVNCLGNRFEEFCKNRPQQKLNEI